MLFQILMTAYPPPSPKTHEVVHIFFKLSDMAEKCGMFCLGIQNVEGPND